MTIAEMPISCPFCVYDVTLGHFVFSMLDTSAPGDIPPDFTVYEWLRDCIDQGFHPVTITEEV